MRDFNIGNGQCVNLDRKEFEVCFRAQDYADDFCENNAYDEGAWLHYNFNRNLLHNRFTPYSSNIETTYFGFDPLAVFVETDETFRNASLKLKRPLEFSVKELKEREIIAFRLSRKLKLFDLCGDYAIPRHNLNLNDPVLVSTHYLESHMFAEEVYQAGYDGIMYPTRQGVKNAVVVFDHTEDVLADSEILWRKSLLTVLRETKDAEVNLGIRITEQE